MTRRDAWTILINGGGTGGLALAALLGTGPSASRLRIRIIEAQPHTRWNPDRLDLRVYALSRSSQSILDRLGLWSSVRAARASAYERMQVWEGDDPFGPASMHFDAADIGEPNLGHIVEDALLKDRLRQCLTALPNVSMEEGAELEAIDSRRSGLTLLLRGGERVHGHLLVGADGTRSTVRQLMAVPVTQRDYGQRAIVAHVESSLPHGGTARQRFMPGGPLAFLPLVDGRSSIVWSLPEPRAAELLGGSDDDFIAALELASGGVLGHLGPVSARASFPLRMLLARRYGGERFVLIGDAVHTVHPLAGQGMNLGLADAACLAREIEQGLQEGRDPADTVVLRRYERRRKGENFKMLAAFDVLNRFFGLPSWLTPVRALGLGAVDHASPVKHWLMRQALGVNNLSVQGWQTGI